MGPPLGADLAPLRRRPSPGGICRIFELIGRCACRISRVGGVGLELIMGFLTGGLEFLKISWSPEFSPGGC
jgi:hypothetical protein